MAEIPIVEKYSKVHKLLFLLTIITCTIIILGNHYDLYDDITTRGSLIIIIILFIVLLKAFPNYKTIGKLYLSLDNIEIYDNLTKSRLIYSYTNVSRFRIIFTGIKGQLKNITDLYYLSNFNGISKIEIIDDQSKVHEYLISITSEYILNLYKSYLKDLDKKYPGKIEFLIESKNRYCI